MGHQRHQGQNFRNRSFVGEPLAGSDFRNADIRGTDFTDADLRRANFSASRAGVPPLWAAVVIASSLLISSAIGVAAALATQAMLQRTETGQVSDLMAVVTVGCIGIVMILIAMFRGFRQAFITGAIVTGVVLVLVVPVLVFKQEFEPQTTAIAIIWILAIVGTFTVGVLARAAAGIISPVAFLLVAVMGTIAARTAGGALFAILIAIAAVILAKRNLANPATSGGLHTNLRRFVLRRSTSFRNANLGDANFDSAIVGLSDFTDAQVLGTTFDGASLTTSGKGDPKKLLNNARTLGSE